MERFTGTIQAQHGLVPVNVKVQAHHRFVHVDTRPASDALDELIDTARGEKNLRRMFEDFLHNYIYLENRTGWFPKKDMLDILRALFAQYNNYGLDFKATEQGSDVDLLLKRHITVTPLWYDLTNHRTEGQLKECLRLRLLESRI